MPAKPQNLMILEYEAPNTLPPNYINMLKTTQNILATALQRLAKHLGLHLSSTL